MKSVLISIRPHWALLIAEGKKTIEIRKTKPKLETPFKCYIYCTKDFTRGTLYNKPLDLENAEVLQGKVIGEFVCDKIFEIEYQCGSYRCKGLTVLENDRVASASKLSLRDIRNYLSCNNGYGWHISNLVIYDKPRELGEFYVVVENEDCGKCKYYDTPCESEPCNQCQGGRKYLTRSPQSWCYVESEVDTE